ncbi:type II toxin-antitoxin system ParD family antitoxin (plasmid) [Nocardia sp. NBC_01503]|uniref:type II toxin-antitoxin system ParD family antitoxin n=1 Tax=Nocardia sp. NBC_01503 TaxID=2975997 RepID=UPI002E7B5F67|nr:type II toxin-antitoxin system ParD family antitoxin [Nocardia sp. NBC_01503]WTL36680.1 type II toxin-antitoxin system ParD family antitoxin [Nocardia sp. NBC_01503]WTL36767.1 type II toxin-antitoxin system ParD family antitoxin [Nocardia sp. NBC_01503]
MCETSDDDQRLHVLREALDVGERSGAATPFDIDALIAHKRARAIESRANDC